MSELTKEKLLEARGLIELGWTQGTPVDPYTQNGSSVCYCLGGAIAKVLFNDPFQMYDRVAEPIFEKFVTLADLPRKLSYDESVAWAESVYDFNDEHSKEEVLDAIDKAVEKIEQS